MNTSTTSNIDADPKDAGLLDLRIEAATRALLDLQQADGHWVFELEADCTISAEYVLLRHFLGEPIDPALEAGIAAYLRRTQGVDGGWPLVGGASADISATVKAYMALKMIGESTQCDHMRRACETVRGLGGAERVNVFTRIALSLHGILSWRSVPMMPVEIMLLPRWFPFHLSKISYWARVVMVPLLVLAALKPRARNPRGIAVDELFLTAPESVGPPPRAPHQSRFWFLVFRAIDRVLRTAEPLFPQGARRRAIEKAATFVRERLNGDDGLGGIFPAMANTVMMFEAMGIPSDHPDAKIARAAIDKLLVRKPDEIYCQPCLSPVWDTSLICHLLYETGDLRARAQADRSLHWLQTRQVCDVAGDWNVARPNLRPGGWAFQYANPHYPDLDDTAVVVMAMDRARHAQDDSRYDVAIDRAREWILGMQCANGGWAAFDADNCYFYLNNIPFSDHGALLDPPSEDVTARCVSMLAQLGDRQSQTAVAAGIEFLRRTQRHDGSWYGRWGVNYIYGTWSALCALNAAGIEPHSTMVGRAVTWLLSIQNADGGWGEDVSSYGLDYRGHEPAQSCASQTAWALLGLMAAAQVDNPAVSRGLRYLMDTQQSDGLWPEDRYTGAGFPRVFYLRYHGYAKFFPLWALARYRNMTASNIHRPPFGM
ncbi:MAG: squalene--hopene cyclase [Proteobacteria bacterium]|nr:squalene--hopene cyclase [Pseudomonadota bacterium]